MTAETFATIVVAAFGSSGLFAFLQYMIGRKDKKDDKFKEIQDSIEKLKEAIEDLKEDLKQARKEFKSQVEDLNEKIDMNQAIQARIRILKANDELRQDVKHSYEYFRQLNYDITEYEKYCSDHPKFKNNEATNSIEYINRIYQDCMDANNFLV